MTLTTLRRFSARSAGIALLLAFSGCVALTDSSTAGPIPVASPGASIAGLSGLACPSNSASCLAWAPAGTTLYVVARSPAAASRDTAVGLFAVNPATASARGLASIPMPASMVVTPDGSALLYSVARDSLDTLFNVYRLPVSGIDTPTVVVRASNPNILVSPDGTTLLFHTLGSSSSSDTVAALNLVSGRIMSTTAGQQLRATSFSPDGRVALVSDTILYLSHYVLAVGAPFIWDMAAGSMTGVRKPTEVSAVTDVEWTRGAFRAFGSGPTGYFEFEIAAGLVTPFGSAAGVPGGAVAWAASRSLMLTAITDGKEYSVSGGSSFYFLREVQPGGLEDAPLGSAKVVSGTTIHPFAPSPDGKWLAYGTASSIYLLAIP